MGKRKGQVGKRIGVPRCCIRQRFRALTTRPPDGGPTAGGRGANGGGRRGGGLRSRPPDPRSGGLRHMWQASAWIPATLAAETSLPPSAVNRRGVAQVRLRAWNGARGGASTGRAGARPHGAATISRTCMDLSKVGLISANFAAMVSTNSALGLTTLVFGSTKVGADSAKLGSMSTKFAAGSTKAGVHHAWARSDHTPTWDRPSSGLGRTKLGPGSVHVGPDSI